VTDVEGLEIVEVVEAVDEVLVWMVEVVLDALVVDGVLLVDGVLVVDCVLLVLMAVVELRLELDVEADVVSVELTEEDVVVVTWDDDHEKVAVLKTTGPYAPHVALTV